MCSKGKDTCDISQSNKHNYKYKYKMCYIHKYVGFSNNFAKI